MINEKHRIADYAVFEMMSLELRMPSLAEERAFCVILQRLFYYRGGVPAAL